MSGQPTHRQENPEFVLKCQHTRHGHFTTDPQNNRELDYLKTLGEWKLGKFEQKLVSTSFRNL